MVLFFLVGEKLSARESSPFILAKWLIVGLCLFFYFTENSFLLVGDFASLIPKKIVYLQIVRR